MLSVQKLSFNAMDGKLSTKIQGNMFLQMDSSDKRDFFGVSSIH